MQTINRVKENFRSVEALRGDLTITALRELYDNDSKARSIIRQRVNKIPADELPSILAALTLNMEELRNTLLLKDVAGDFKSDFARTQYLFRLLENCVV